MTVIPPSLPPVGGGGPSLGPLPPPSSPSGFTSDRMSGYSADIAAGNTLSIKDFSHIVLSATNESDTVSWNSQQFNAGRRQNFYLSLAQEALSALAILTRQIQNIGEYRSIVEENDVRVNQINDLIQYYNDNVVPGAQPLLDDLNAAIDDFNNGDIDIFELNDAVDFYNAQADLYNAQVDQLNTDVSDFNTYAAAVNQEIELLNEARTEDVDPFIGQDLVTRTAFSMPIIDHFPEDATTVSHISFSPNTLIPINNTMSPASAEIDALLKGLNDKYTSLIENQLALSTAILQAQSTHEGFVQFYLQGVVPALPPAFITPTPQPALGSTGSAGSAGGGGGSGSGSGVSLASIITSLSNPIANAIIAQGIFVADMQLQSLPSTPAVVAQLQYLGLRLLSQIGLQAGSLAVRLLADRLAFVDIRSSPVAVALGLTLASEIGLGVTSGAVSAAVKQLLTETYPGIDAAKLSTLASQLTAALELILLQSALLQLAQTLKTPSLVGQLLGTLPSAQSLGTAASAPTFSNTNTAALQNALARNLASQLNSSYAESSQFITNSLISASIQEQFDQQAIVDELVQKGISNQIAINLANYAQAYVKAEVFGRGLLDQNVSQERLNNSILNNQLVSQLVSGQPNLTNRDLRDQLARRFVSSGNTQENALLAATIAVVGNGGISPTDPEVLKDNLMRTATARLAGLGNSASETQSIANQLVSTVLGPNIPGSQTSIRDLIDERLSVLLKSGDQSLVDAVRANMTRFLEPTVELYAFAEALRDPANTFLLCAQTGLMYSHQQPSNYIRGVDIIV